MIRVLSLFSGIGGIDLGLAWTGGFEAVAFCEIDPPWGPGWEDGTPRVVTSAEDKVDRRKRLIGLGNAVVPQIVEIIGRAILEAEDAA